MKGKIGPAYSTAHPCLSPESRPKLPKGAATTMQITTTPTLEGQRTITTYLGPVSGSVVQSKHIGRDIMAGLKTIVGGEIRGYTELLEDARKQATKRMCAEAEALGADAVVNVRFTTSQVMQGMSELLAYGTAVKLS